MVVLLQKVVVATYVVVLASGLLCDFMVCSTEFVIQIASSDVQIQ